ncbi:hypothetical protein HD806DRAFT_75906 [Xylariaceae sp. AK1471]|nr:hypothetical protein HD806DRAFT_75906 [Xylariaceae sp. AK1471]
MSDGRRVTFSSNASAPLRGVLKHPESHYRDSGVGSSSSDHTSTSGSLDERFTARNYNAQTTNVDALREAFNHLIQDHEQLKNKYQKKEDEIIELRKFRRDADKRYEEECDRAVEVEGRMKNLDVALDEANDTIARFEFELDEWKTKYNNLYVIYQDSKLPADAAMMSGGSGESSQQLERTRSRREKKDSEDLTLRMKERINRDSTSEGSHASRSSRSSEGTTSTGRARRLEISTNNQKPYMEKMPGDKRSTTDSTTTRRHPQSSSSRSGQREQGDYVAHPLPLTNRPRRH